MADQLPRQNSAVGIDSMIFNWLFRDSVDDKWDDDHKWKWVLSKILQNELKARNCSIIVPAVVLAESLAGLAENRQQDFFNKMLSRCRIEQFDQWTALKAAQIYRQHHGFKDLELNRVVLKADLQIVASLLGKVSCLFSHDKGCRKVANKSALPAFDFPWPISDWVEAHDLMEQVGLDKKSKPSWIPAKAT